MVWLLLPAATEQAEEAEEHEHEEHADDEQPQRHPLDEVAVRPERVVLNHGSCSDKYSDKYGDDNDDSGGEDDDDDDDISDDDGDDDDDDDDDDDENNINVNYCRK